MSESRRQINLQAMRPQDIEIVMPDGKVLTHPPLGVDTVARLFANEERLNDADADKAFEVMRGIKDELLELLRVHNRDVPNYDLTVQDILGLMGGLIGAATVADGVADALAGSGLLPADVEKALRGPESPADGQQAPGATGGREVTPLASRRRSRSRSSGSAKSTTGRRSGGSTPAAPGRRSRSTSATRSTT